MTEKQENIVLVALRLFAEQGYESTPTSQIAKAAGVSEGLIFKHFTNKEGLLGAIMTKGTEKIKQFTKGILQLKNPVQLIHKVIDLPVEMIQQEKEFWMLQHNLKTQSKKYAKFFQDSNTLQPLTAAVQDAFIKLNYENPAQETMYLFTVLNGLTTVLLSEADEKQHRQLVKFIKHKFEPK
jgi:AcrR family transcriptional regulator